MARHGAPLVGPTAAAADRVFPWILGPIPRLPRHPLDAARFGLPALLPVAALAALAFREAPARALLAALSAHAISRLEEPASAAYGLVLAAGAHAHGWPVVAGGSQRLADALVDEARRLGVAFEVGRWVTSLDELPPARATVLDVGARALPRLAGDRLPAGYARRLERFRAAPGACKVDWALDRPIPWRARDLAGVATVHFGGDVGNLRALERAVHKGRMPARPYVILVQPTVADPSRAPAGAATAWAYAHVPAGWPGDASGAIEALVEEAAPGFRASIVGRHVRTARALELYNPNYVGGDIGGGAMDFRQVIGRPVLAVDPYRTPLPGVYLGSASTPPGGGVHGMSGYHAARSALRREFGIPRDPLAGE